MIPYQSTGKYLGAMLSSEEGKPLSLCFGVKAHSEVFLVKACKIMYN